MEQPNNLYPGRPNYEGPTEGIFGLVHHDVLFEASEDIMERVDFIREHKPKDEVKTRLHCLVYLPPERLPINLVEAQKAYDEAEKAYDEAGKAYVEARKAYDEARKAFVEARKAYDEARKAYVEAQKAYDEAGKAYNEAGKAYNEARKAYIKVRKASYEAVEDLIKELVPDCPWDGKKLDFTKADPK